MQESPVNGVVDQAVSTAVAHVNQVGVLHQEVEKTPGTVLVDTLQKKTTKTSFCLCHLDKTPKGLCKLASYHDSRNNLRFRRTFIIFNCRKAERCRNV